MNRPRSVRIAIFSLVACATIGALPVGAIEPPAEDPLAAAASALAGHFDGEQDGLSETVVEPAADGFDVAHAHVEDLTALAELVAQRVPDADADLLLTAWTNTTDQRLRVVLAALAQTGDPYKFATAGPDAFDCSGLSKYAWGTVGVQLFHYSRRQIDDATPIDRSQLQPGDLVWRPGHVMLYLGAEDLIVNAVQPGKPVTVKRWGKVQRFGSPILDIEPPDDPSGS